MSISVITPFLNEEGSILKYCGHMDNIAKDMPCDIEIIFVDDGSKDNTVNLLRGFKFKNLKAKIIKFSKNFGAHAAIRAGILHSTGDYCIFMAVDMQEPDDLLSVAYAEIIKGYDIVYLDKNTIEISAFEKMFSRMFAFLMRKFAVKNYPSNSTGNIMFSRKVKNYLNDNVENNSSIHLQILDSGFNSTSIMMDYNARDSGKSRWTMSAKIKLFIDSFVAFSFFPLRLVSVMGIVMFMMGLGYGGYTVIGKIFKPDMLLGYPTIVTLLSIGFGITNIALGIIAEYLWRTYDEARARPVFIIDEIYED